MKVVLPTLVLLLGFAASVSGVNAQDGASCQSAQDGKLVHGQTGYLPRGGWDGNNLKIYVKQSGLLKADATSQYAPRPGGGWDLNDLRISVTRSKLLKSDGTAQYSRPSGGGWDANNLRVSVTHSNLIAAGQK